MNPRVADGKMVALGIAVTRLAFIVCLGGLSGPGCFYVEPVNQRPAVSIGSTSSEAVYRGDAAVSYVAVYNDSDGHDVDFRWRVYNCVDAVDFATCDVAPHHQSDALQISFAVAKFLADGVTPVQSLLLKLEAEDAYGATARPIAELVVPVLDREPELALEVAPNEVVVNTSIELYARVRDSDDGPSNVLPLVWTVAPELGPPVELEDLALAQDPDDLASLQFGKRLTPSTVGTWNVEVTASDPLGASTTEHLSFNVKQDRDPCLGELFPLVPPAGVAYPLIDPTLFQARRVDDDLDPFPPADTGTTTFEWSIQVPGSGDHVVIAGASGNSYALDPAQFTPGDIVELRVEVFDRAPTPIGCNEADPTCSVISDPMCLQRQTWRVEVR
ncbi:MAG: hypothetical protein AB7O24_14205 [Kofleriaceae bacterium]